MWKKMMFALAAVALFLSVLPGTAQAAGLREGKEPPPDGARLVAGWERLRDVYEKTGERLAQSDARLAEVQTRLDAAAANGLDTSSAQAALDAMRAAVDDARTLYAEAESLVAAHPGFDADGKVTDPEQAVETLRALAEKLKAIGERVRPAEENLRAALRELRESQAPSPEDLSQAWQDSTARYAEIGQRFDRSEALIRRVSALLDKAAENGADLGAARDALDAFSAAVADARALYAEGQSLVSAHAGFDADGAVTDPEQAAETLRTLRETMKAIQEAVGPAGKNLRQALEALRSALPERKLPPRTPRD